MCCQILARVLQSIANSLRKLMSTETHRKTKHSELKSIREFKRARHEAAYNGRYEILISLSGRKQNQMLSCTQKYDVSKIALHCIALYCSVLYCKPRNFPICSEDGAGWHGERPRIHMQAIRADSISQGFRLYF